MNTISAESVEYDPHKARINKGKHNVTFDEAASVVNNPYGFRVEVPDDAHSDTEERFIMIGFSNRSRLLMVVFTTRGDVIRIISARKAPRKIARKHFQL